MPTKAPNQPIDKTELWTQEELLALYLRSESRSGQDDPKLGQTVSEQPVYRLIHDSFKLGIFSFLYRLHGRSETVTTLLRAQ